MSDELPLISLDIDRARLLVDARVGPATVMATDGSDSVETVFIQATTVAANAEASDPRTEVLALSPELALALYGDLGLGLRVQRLI